MKNPGLVLLVLLNNEAFAHLFSDKAYLKIKYRLLMNEKLNLKNPKTFNEKLQWLKLFDRKDEYTMMVDKYAVREYIKDTIGEEYLIPLLGVWDNPDDIDFDSLPNQFVLKCNHNSGLGMYICKDKSTLDIEKVKKDLKKGLRQNYFITSREWPYKNVKRRIVAEQYMEDSTYGELRDYKFYCFGGVPRYIYVSRNLADPVAGEISFYDMEFNEAPFHRNDYKMLEGEIVPPASFETMVEYAKTLSQGHKFLRVDFYDVDGKLFFGELTFYPTSGNMKLEPENWEYKLGELISLPIDQK